VSNTGAGDIFSGGGLMFVNAAMKQALADGGVPFALVGASGKGRNQFGDDETSFVIRVSAKAAVAAGDEALEGDFKLSLSHNEVRERQANDVVAALAAPGVTSIGPVFLAQVTTKSGKSAWVITNEPATEPSVAVSPTGGALEPAGKDDLDSIPF
jgi:hypothetical protein